MYETTVYLEKDVTIFNSNRTGLYTAKTCKYKELEDELKHKNEITVNYCYGKRRTREEQLRKLGYFKVADIFYNTEAPHSKIRQVWKRGRRY